MCSYYFLSQSKSQVFLLERKLKDAKIACEITFLPRELMAGLCDMGIRIPRHEFNKAIGILKIENGYFSVFMEEVYPGKCLYTKIGI